MTDQPAIGWEVWFTVYALLIVVAFSVVLALTGNVGAALVASSFVILAATWAEARHIPVNGGCSEASDG